MTLRKKPSLWFWIIAVLLLLWNLLGLSAFAIEIFSPDLVTASLNDQQLEIYNDRPGWYMYNYSMAVLAGTFASILLLAGKKLAVPLAVLSLVAVLVSSVYNLYAGAMDFVEMSDKILFYLILVLNVVLVVVAMYAVKKRWIV